MNKEKLQHQLAELEKALQQSAANHNMIIGRMEECRYWLAEFEKKESIQSSIDVAN